MKYIISISFLLVSFIIFNSCKDSLGIENNVIVTRLDSTGKDTTRKDSIKKIPATIDSLWFEEYFISDDVQSSFYIDDKIISSKVFVDTSTYPVYVWIELNIENQNSDEIYQYINHKIFTKTINFIADSLPAEGTYNLNGASNSGQMSELGVRDITNPSNPISTIYPGYLTNFKITFTIKFVGYIETQITAFIPYSTDPRNPTQLLGTFRIKYK
jgi:hypothetical protein